MTRTPGTLLLLPALLLIAGCPRKRDKDAEDDGSADDLQRVEDSLSLSAVDPASVPSAQPFEVTLYGSGFAPGAQVRFGDQSATSVTFASERTLDVNGPALPAGRYDVEVVLTTGERSRLVQGLRVNDDAAACREVTVYFGLDKDQLNEDSLSILRQNLACLQQTSAPITVEGHTDERGTTEYNLALGQRRASSVRDWLVRQGVTAGRIRSVTFGEERPVDPGSNEAAWSRNRRAVVILGN